MRCTKIIEFKTLIEFLKEFLIFNVILEYNVHKNNTHSIESSISHFNLYQCINKYWNDYINSPSWSTNSINQKTGLGMRAYNMIDLQLIVNSYV